MFSNYIKIAWRSILKNKGIFSINIAGLALGISACLIIMLFVVDELSYDRFNKNADEIVRVVFKAKINGEVMKEASVMPPVAHALKNDIPEVLDATRIVNAGNPKIIYGNKSYRDSRFAYVDPNFFKVFTFPVLKGENNNPLKEPNSIVLTETEAKKYFGDQNPIGKILNLPDQNAQYNITAIIKDIPKNSHFHFDMLASMTGYTPAKENSWVTSGYHTYLLLKKDADYKNVEAKLPVISEKYMGPQLKGAVGMSFADFIKDKNEIGIFLQPLTDIHLKSDFISATEIEQGGDIKYVYIFSAVVLFMLLIACINFMNLSTAAASKRAKEVGIRKVLGSNKKQLIYQFLSESFIATCLAMLLALVIFVTALPFFNTLSGKELQTDYLFQPQVISALLLLILVISIFAGGYPAFFLSSFKPIAALKNKLSGLGKSNSIRSGLVVFQFVVSAGLILATLIVNQQMQFIQQKNLGYEKDQILVLRESYLLGENEASFKNEILKDPRVENVTQSSFVPAGQSDNSMDNVYLGDQYQRRIFVYNIDEQYIPTMGMKLVSGRNFSNDFGSDSTKVIINESAAKVLGFDKDALGKTLMLKSGELPFIVIGVIKDFNFRSLHQKIDPLIMVNYPYGGLIVRTKVADMSGLISHINGLWNKYQVKEPFSYSVLDDAYNATYLTEEKMGTILTLFAIITIFVACPGLFGLVTYAAEQRFKEIGIRKVLGSSVTQIVSLLSRDFIKLVLLSFLIAFPLGYYLMQKWLQDFAYRIEISVWIYLLTAVITLLIAFITISFKSIQAAMANPVKSLHTE